MRILFFLSVAATASGHHQDCSEYCQYRSPVRPWLPWCECSPEATESYTPRDPRLYESSQYDEAAIYYEPDQAFQTKFNYQKPLFYIENPTSKVGLKTQKREIDNTLHVTESVPITINNLLISQENPVYLDISVKDSAEPRNADELNHIELTEKSLLECLDLHLIVLSRRGSEKIPSQVVQPEILEKSKMMSDAELIMAIKSKCSQPIKIVNRSLQKIQESQPTRINYASQRLENLTSESSFETYRHSLGKETNLSFDISAREKILNLTDYTPDGNVTVIENNASTKAVVDLVKSANTNNKSDHCTSESKLVCTRSTLSSPSTRISDDTIAYYSTEDLVHDNDDDSAKKATSYNKTIEDHNLTYSTETIFTTVTNDNITNSLPAKYFSGDVESTTQAEITIEDYSSDDIRETRHPITKSTIAVDDTTISAENRDGYTTSLESLITTLPITYDEVSQPTSVYEGNLNISEENYHYLRSAVNVSKDHELRQRFKEGEVLIPKILTKELANGNVVSTIEGYELLPNGDFTVNIDELSYEDTTTADILELASRRSFDTTNHIISPHQSEISGNLYFIFDNALIPTRFVQHSDGRVSLGVDGNTMCNNFLEKHGHGSQFLSKLCRAVIREKYDDKTPVVESVHIADENDKNN